MNVPPGDSMSELRVTSTMTRREQQLFRTMSILPALRFSPRKYYATHQCVTSQSWYQRMREKVLPVPEMTRVPARRSLEHESAHGI